MARIIGVRFRQAGKIYYFDPGELDIKAGEHIIVETARGVEYGKVSIAPREVEDQELTAPLKKVIRKALPEDDEKNMLNRKKEREAFQICQERIAKYELEMKLIDVEYTFDNNKILFYFTADGRIDFRELVKDLASVFKTRIELRQIGVRDETKLLGGIGICGRPLCCHSYMSDFLPVSIKMAKEQTLSLNPAKISGVCGRLMCCLKYEQETYEWLHSKLPAVGTKVTTEEGFEGVVGSVNVMRQKVKVVITLENDEKEAKEYDLDQLVFKGTRREGSKKTRTQEEYITDPDPDMPEIERQQDHPEEEPDISPEKDPAQKGKRGGRQKTGDAQKKQQPKPDKGRSPRRNKKRKHDRSENKDQNRSGNGDNA